jgi:predicted ATPase/DNA-binding CsgD family transcriptional regulator
MAPEMFYSQTVAASDQYALAAMVYEWLCGQLPFESLAADMSNHRLHTGPPSLCEAHPDIPRAVEQVVLKGLSKEPSQRFIDVLSFARALEEASQAVSSPYYFAALPEIHDAAARSIQYWPATHFQKIPRPLTPLIGREKELQVARDLLLRQQVRLVTLTGPGGIGKTHLALELGNEFLETFAEGVCFVPLSTVYDSEHVIPAIVHALGLPEMRDSSPMNLLKTALSTRHLLLVLDSFDQVLPAASHLADLLSACPGLKILVTSRALLHVGGEYRYAIQPLEIPDLWHVSEPENLSQVASVELFVQRIQAIQPGFQLTVENAGDIAAICTRLEGVPLATELAAEQCNVLTPRALLSRLEHPLEVLMGRRGDAPPRHLSLLKTLSWNDDLLTSDEQTLFRRFAVFVGGCSLQAIETISTALGGIAISVLDGVRSLVDKSLLGFSVDWRDEPRLSLLELIRAYALKRLTECGELTQARDAHAAYYLELAEKALRIADTKHARWQEVLERDAGNMRAAVEWLQERKKGEDVLRLVAALVKFWPLSGLLSDGYSFLVEALEVPEKNQGSISPTIQMQALDDRDERGMAIALLGEGVKLYGEIAENNHTECAVKKEEAVVSLEALPGNRTVFSLRMTEPLLQPSCAELTVREIEVLRLLATGLSNKAIAGRLVLSPHTVSAHIHSIFSKLDVHSRSAATRYALDHQLA